MLSIILTDSWPDAITISIIATGITISFCMWLLYYPIKGTNKDE